MRPSFAAVAAGLTVVSCAGEGLGDPRYAADQCRRVALEDTRSRLTVVGAEDFAIDRTDGRLFVSAYDRRAADRAAKRGKDEVPSGGLYSIALSELFNPEKNSIAVTSLISPQAVGGGLRPHGLSFLSETNELVVINRAYSRANRAWEMTPQLMRINLTRPELPFETTTARCAANDVLATKDETYTSFDHGRCDWRAGIEDIFNLKQSGLVASDEASVFDGVAFANGLAQTPGGEILLAATRQDELLVLSASNGSVKEASRLSIPGGPDNLTISDDGAVVVAAHKSLWRLGLNRKMGIGKAPSRILKVIQNTDSIELLFDDPSGKLFSAATVAVETNDGLVIGSVTDEGLLVCQDTL